MKDLAPLAPHPTPVPGKHVLYSNETMGAFVTNNNLVRYPIVLCQNDLDIAMAMPYYFNEIFRITMNNAKYIIFYSGSGAKVNYDGPIPTRRHYFVVPRNPRAYP